MAFFLNVWCNTNTGKEKRKHKISAQPILHVGDNMGLKRDFSIQSYFVSNKNIRTYFQDYEIKAIIESGYFGN